MDFRVPKSVIRKGVAFAKQVHENRKENKDKFITGKEAAMDVQGFIVEFAHAYVFKLPYPELYSGKQVDEFDTTLWIKFVNNFVEMNFDIKHSRDRLINKPQFERKEKVQAYLFESIKFMGAENDFVLLRVHGWILKEDVPLVSKIKEFGNGSFGYVVPSKNLKRASVLYSFQNGEYLKPLEWKPARRVG